MKKRIVSILLILALTIQPIGGIPADAAGQDMAAGQEQAENIKDGTDYETLRAYLSDAVDETGMSTYAEMRDYTLGTIAASTSNIEQEVEYAKNARKKYPAELSVQSEVETKSGSIESEEPATEESEAEREETEEATPEESEAEREETEEAMPEESEAERGETEEATPEESEAEREETEEATPEESETEREETEEATPEESEAEREETEEAAPEESEAERTESGALGQTDTTGREERRPDGVAAIASSGGLTGDAAQTFHAITRPSFINKVNVPEYNGKNVAVGSIDLFRRPSADLSGFKPSRKKRTGFKPYPYL